MYLFFVYAHIVSPSFDVSQSSLYLSYTNELDNNINQPYSSYSHTESFIPVLPIEPSHSDQIHRFAYGYNSSIDMDIFPDNDQSRLKQVSNPTLIRQVSEPTLSSEFELEPPLYPPIHYPSEHALHSHDYNTSESTTPILPFNKQDMETNQLKANSLNNPQSKNSPDF